VRGGSQFVAFKTLDGASAGSRSGVKAPDHRIIFRFAVMHDADTGPVMSNESITYTFPSKGYADAASITGSGNLKSLKKRSATARSPVTVSVPDCIASVRGNPPKAKAFNVRVSPSRTASGWIT
jgi:hypothetical protein